MLTPTTTTTTHACPGPGIRFEGDGDRCVEIAWDRRLKPRARAASVQARANGEGEREDEEEALDGKDLASATHRSMLQDQCFKGMLMSWIARSVIVKAGKGGKQDRFGKSLTTVRLKYPTTSLAISIGVHYPDERSALPLSFARQPRRLDISPTKTHPSLTNARRNVACAIGVLTCAWALVLLDEHICAAHLRARVFCRAASYWRLPSCPTPHWSSAK